MLKYDERVIVFVAGWIGRNNIFDIFFIMFREIELFDE
jgi:hypothetical protein